MKKGMISILLAALMVASIGCGGTEGELEGLTENQEEIERGLEEIGQEGEEGTYGPYDLPGDAQPVPTPGGDDQEQDNFWASYPTNSYGNVDSNGEGYVCVDGNCI